jgi:N-acylglucosamine-6-phosphate 2-epimerase
MLSTLRRSLLVSCQAPTDSPLHHPTVITAIAQAALLRGAKGVRLDTPAHVQAVRDAIPDAFIIGLWKREFPGYSVYITPQFEQAKAIAQAGADMIAIDATLRERPGGETVPNLIHRIHTELGKTVMADVDTLAAAQAAAAAGADWVGTTLYGYTEATANQIPPGLDLLAQMSQSLTVPCICEGGIGSPALAGQALKWGAYAVVVGTAITGIDRQVQQYCEVLNSITLTEEED